jgi:hypothetical protein
MTTLKIYPKEITRGLREGTLKSARDISWHILEQKRECLEDDYGDCADNSLGLAILEQALDWRIGCAIIGILRSMPKGKVPKPFKMHIRRGGKLSVTWDSGKTIDLPI